MRLFVAFPLPKDVADACAALAARLPEGPVKRVRAELLHLTLAFIGEVGEDVAAVAVAAVAEAAAGVQAFRARLGAHGAFPTARSPRVIWVGLAEGSDSVRASALRVREQLTRRSVPFDDAPPVAHVTVARLRDRVTPAERAAVRDAVAALAGQVPPVAFEVTDIHLMRSVLARTGPTYSTVSRATLAQAATGRLLPPTAPRG